MSDDVTIPRETAALRARQLRYLADGNDDRLALYADDLRAVADLLDPPPTRLHERVVDLLQHPRGRTYQELASDVVTVVADCAPEWRRMRSGSRRLDRSHRA